MTVRIAGMVAMSIPTGIPPSTVSVVATSMIASVRMVSSQRPKNPTITSATTSPAASQRRREACQVTSATTAMTNHHGSHRRDNST